MDLPAQYAEVGVTVVTRPGKLTVCYGKWPIEIDGLPFLKMVIFYSYVSLPEGNHGNLELIDELPSGYD